jgi:GNAT superfamily N-acetyltransferase
MADRPLLKATIVEVPNEYSHPLFEFSTSADPMVTHLNRPRKSDLSLKRNIGLALARLAGWRKIFFLDDDIYGLTINHLNDVVCDLEQYSCVAFSMRYFPDNSVVSHARRLINESHQEVFISGAAMGVKCQPDTTFFPDIYNEDLFFVIDELAANRVLYAGSLSQVPYDPFDDPARAASEEFGEVVIGGLLALLRQRYGMSRATTTFWAHFLERRRTYLESTSAHISVGSQVPNRQPALECLEAAQARLREIDAERCVAFLAKWREDQDAWSIKLGSTAEHMSVSNALMGLKLPFILSDRAQDYLLPTSPFARMSKLAVRGTGSGHSLISSAMLDLDRTVSELTRDWTQSIEARFTVIVLAENEWQILRDIRLRALHDSPTSFAAEYANEAKFGEDQWRSLLGPDLRWFVVLDQTLASIGLSAVRTEPGNAYSRYVESMWVAPELRGQGVARLLVRELVRSAISESVETLFLWVLDRNETARIAYMHLGFVETGERQPIAVGNQMRIEERFALKLR